MDTYVASGKKMVKEWKLIDAKGMVLGRLATEVAMMLMGKNKPTYSPHLDDGDYVVVVNASKLVLTADKLDKKKYYYHSGYPGGIKEVSYRTLMEKKPSFVLEKAVKGMLPKNKLASRQIRNLKVFDGDSHEHAAQKPVEVKIN